MSQRSESVLIVQNWGEALFEIIQVYYISTYLPESYKITRVYRFMVNLFVKGVIIGFSIAAPVGPIGILCIRRSLQFGRLSGFISGLGAAIADVIYGAVAAFGLNVISNFILSCQSWFRWFGGIFVLYLGLRTFFYSPKEKNLSVSHKTLLSDFVSTFILTMINPMTILSYMAIFVGSGCFEVADNFRNGTFILTGIFFGAAFWWLLLSGGVGFFRNKVSLPWMKRINYLAGSIIVLFSLAILFGFFGCR